jgi:hypothetical protein
VLDTAEQKPWPLHGSGVHGSDAAPPAPALEPPLPAELPPALDVVPPLLVVPPAFDAPALAEAPPSLDSPPAFEVVPPAFAEEPPPFDVVPPAVAAAPEAPLPPPACPLDASPSAELPPAPSPRLVAASAPPVSSSREPTAHPASDADSAMTDQPAFAFESSTPVSDAKSGMRCVVMSPTGNVYVMYTLVKGRFCVGFDAARGIRNIFR